MHQVTVKFLKVNTKTLHNLRFNNYINKLNNKVFGTFKKKKQWLYSTDNVYFRQNMYVFSKILWEQGINILFNRLDIYRYVPFINRGYL